MRRRMERDPWDRLLLREQPIRRALILQRLARGYIVVDRVGAPEDGPHDESVLRQIRVL